MVSAAPPRAFTLKEPGAFLRQLAEHSARLDLEAVSLAEMWSLAAIVAVDV